MAEKSRKRSSLYRQPCLAQALPIRHGCQTRNEAACGRFNATWVDAASDGAYSRHPRQACKPQWHIHDLNFQMIYILKGWVVFEYEGAGEVTFRAGSAALQPPGIKHREIRHSDDLELIEITSPAEFATTLTDPPED